MGHGELAHCVGGSAPLGARLFEKLGSRRDRMEQITHLNTGAGRLRVGHRSSEFAGVGLNCPGFGRAPGTAGHAESGNGRDRRQRLSPKAKGFDMG